MGTELPIRANEPADGIHHTVVVVRDLGLEPWAMALDQVGRVGGTNGGQEERQRIDAVFVHIAGAREVVNGRGDVVATPGPDVQRVRQRVEDARAMPEPDQGRDRERQVAGPEHVEMPGAGGEGPAVPAGFDAGLNDRRRVADMAGVAAELSPNADPDVVYVLGQDGRGDPGCEGHATASRA